MKAEKANINQGNLFDDEEDICRNYHRGEPFSELANESVAATKQIQRERIIHRIAQVGNTTSDESERALGMCHQTSSARFSELKKAGVIVAVLDAKGKPLWRPTRHGRKAGVYRLRRQEESAA